MAEENPLNQSQRTGTMLDTSSDEDSDGPMELTADLVNNLTKTTEPFQHKPSMIPGTRTQALPKGRINKDDLIEEVKKVEKFQTSLPMTSHALPKGKLKLAQQNKGAQQQKKARITSLDLLTSLAAVSEAKVPTLVIEEETYEYDEKEDEERLRQEIQDYKNKAKGSKIGGGIKRADFSASPRNKKPAQQQADDDESLQQTFANTLAPKRGIPQIGQHTSSESGQSMFTRQKSGKGKNIFGRTSSKIGMGASRVPVSPTRVTKNPIATSGHFGTKISPVKDDEEMKAKPARQSTASTTSTAHASLHEAFLKIDELMPFGDESEEEKKEQPVNEEKPAIEDQEQKKLESTLDAKYLIIGDKSTIEQSEEPSPVKSEALEDKNSADGRQNIEDHEVSALNGPSHNDESTSLLNSLDDLHNDYSLRKDAEEGVETPVEVFADQSSLHSESEHEKSPPKKIVRKADPVFITVTEVVTINEIETSVEDLLVLSKQINRRSRADIIKEVQNQLDEMEAAMTVDPNMPIPNANFEMELDFSKYRPGMLSEWDFEINKLEPREISHSLNEDKSNSLRRFKTNLEKFETPNETPKDEQEVEIELDMTLDVPELDVTADVAQPPQSDDSDSDDLLNSIKAKHVSQQILTADSLFEEDDSPSHILPVPPHLRDQIQPSSTKPYTKRDSLDQDLMTEKETMDHLAQEALEKNAQLYQVGDLDAISEQDEDLYSQMNRLGESGRESIMVSHRGSIAQPPPAPEDILGKINMDQRQQNRQSMQSKREHRRNRPQFMSQDFNVSRMMQSTSLVAPIIGAGEESLATRESRRPRSSSQRGRNGGGDSDLFDADSDMFSALNQTASELSSLNISNKSPKSKPQMKEHDIDLLDQSQINLLPKNEKFAHLVQQSELDKLQRDNRHESVQVSTTSDAQEKNGNESVRDSKNFLIGELPKPLSKPKNDEEKKAQQKELRELVTYKAHDDNTKEETFMDTIPTKGKILTHNSGSFEVTINMSSLLSLLLTDSSLKKSRTVHTYLCEDRELSKSRIALKSLYEQLAKQGDKLTAAFVLLKLAKVYFCLNQLNNAVTTISHAVDEISRQNEMKPPADTIFWKGLIYFYLIFTKRAQHGQRKMSQQRKNEAQKELSKMIDTCENALISATEDPLYKLNANFLLLKLSLFVIRERFGCDLVCITKSDPSRICETIRSMDAYYGTIAQSELLVDGKQKNLDQAKSTLEKVIIQSPRRGEAYIKLWQLNMYLGNELQRSQSQQQLADQRSQQRVISSSDLTSSMHQSSRQSGRTDSMLSGSQMEDSVLSQSQRCSLDISNSQLDGAGKAERAKQYYMEAHDIVASRLLQNCDESFATPPQQRILLTFLTVKSLQKSGQYIQAFELLQREFCDNPQIVSLMYLYGKFVVKAMASEVHTQLIQFSMQLQGLDLKKKRGKDFRIDDGYLGSGIGALEECLRSCFTERQAKVNYYIGFAYKVLRMPLKTQEFWLKAQNLQKQSRTLSYQQANQVTKFLEEQLNFTIIADKSDNLIKEKLGTVKPDPAIQNLPEKARKDLVQSYRSSIKMMERIDKPNSMLFQARLDGYVVEANGQSQDYGQAFSQLLNTYPTFIDGYIHHWHYLKWRLASLSQQTSSAILGGAKKPKHADQITDASGKSLLDMMRTCAENALQYCDAAEVPTSLWVEARIIYAKQMIFDKEIGHAIRILKDISYIIPPYPIEGLSYVQTLEEESELPEDSSDLLQEESQVNEMSAEDIFQRHSDLAKARNNPRGRQINKGQAQFQKVRYNATAEAGSRSNALPKGKVDLQMLTQQEKDEVNFNIPRSEALPKGQFSSVIKQYGRTESMPDVRIEDTDMFAQMEVAESNYHRESMYQPRGAELLTIFEEQDSSANRSSAVPADVFEEEESGHMQDAQNLLDRIAKMNQKGNPAMRGTAQNMNSTVGARASNRVSMYRRPNQLQGSGSATMHVKNRDSIQRSMTIYNPFGFNKEITDGRHAKKVREVSMSLEGPLSGHNVLAKNDGQMRNEQLELAYQAMLKVQQAWQEKNEIRNNALSRSSSQIDDSQSQIMSEFRQDNINDSENFAIYSNFKFLQLIGKFCAKSKQYSDEGLKALNDYLLLIEYHRSSYTKEQYYDERAITIFYIGSIFYNCRDYFHAIEHLLPIQEQLHMGKHYKELSQSERKISKIWRQNFNEQSIILDYFSSANINENFKALEAKRQAGRMGRQQARAQASRPTMKTKIHKLHH